MSRAVGDFDYKNVERMGPTEQLVSPESEFFTKPILPDQDDLILDCDGMWDVMTNEAICEFVTAKMKVTDNLEMVANEVIAFPNANKPVPAAILEEEELN